MVSVGRPDCDPETSLTSPLGLFPGLSETLGDDVATSVQLGEELSPSAIEQTATVRVVTASDGLPVTSDSAFQRKLRELQSRWREEQVLPIGEHRGRPLGSRLAMPFAEESLANYLTPAIRDVVRSEVVEPTHDQDKLYGRPRIFDDLLSSQPLCFNLFGELSVDTAAATEVFRLLWPSRISRVTSIDFEWSPGRGDERYLGNRSAFDVFVRHTTPDDGDGFIGIEVKYHENLKGSAATHRLRYDELTRASNVFIDPDSEELRRLPLQQIWLDHLLALSMLEADEEYERGLFVFLYPTGNRACATASDRYRALLSDTSTFERLTLEAVVAAIRWAAPSSWIEAVNDRYFNIGKLGVET